MIIQNLSYNRYASTSHYLILYDIKQSLILHYYIMFKNIFMITKESI